MPDKLRAFFYFVATEAIWVLLVVPVFASADTGSWWPHWRGIVPTAIGGALAAAGAVLSYRAAVRLVEDGAGTPLPIRPPTRLVTSGPYAHIRNPQAVGLVAMTGGAALAVDARALWLVPVLAASYAVLLQVPGEVRQLRERFGEEYDRYAAAVPPWIPRRA